jgi:hypothetical protein
MRSCKGAIGFVLVIIAAIAGTLMVSAMLSNQGPKETPTIPAAIDTESTIKAQVAEAFTQTASAGSIGLTQTAIANAFATLTKAAEVTATQTSSPTNMPITPTQTPTIITLTPVPPSASAVVVTVLVSTTPQPTAIQPTATVNVPTAKPTTAAVNVSSNCLSVSDFARMWDARDVNNPSVLIQTLDAAFDKSGGSIGTQWLTGPMVVQPMSLVWTDLKHQPVTLANGTAASSDKWVPLNAQGTWGVFAVYDTVNVPTPSRTAKMCTSLNPAQDLKGWNTR